MALVQAVGKIQGTGATAIGSGDGWVSSTAGSTIIVFADNSSAAAYTGVTDNIGNTYVAGTALSGCSCYYSINTLGGVTTVTLSTSGAAHNTVIAIEESGLASLDGNPAVLHNSSVTTFNSNNITTTNAADVAYGYFGNSSSDFGALTPNGGGGGGTWAAISGTGITSGAVNSVGNCGVFVERMALTSTATFTASTTQSLASGDVGVIAFAKTAAAGPALLGQILT